MLASMRSTCLIALATLLLSCNLIPGTEQPDDVSPLPGDWRLDRPAQKTVSPGQVLELHVRGVDVDAANLRLWVDDIAWPVLRVRTVGADTDPTTLTDNEVVIRHPLPVFVAGKVRVALGTDEARKTGVLELQVVVPQPRLTQQEAAEVLAQGYRALIAQVRRPFEDPHPEVQAMLADVLGEAHPEVLGVLTELGPVADDMAAQYRQLGAEDEAALQAFLDASGILPTLEELAGVSAKQVPRAMQLTIEDRLTHPTARVLFYLDANSAALSALGDVVSLVNIAALFAPGGQPFAPLTFSAKIVVATLRVIIDVVFPTDLRELDPQIQPVLFHAEGSEWIYWGRFEPQNGLAGGAVSIIDTIASLVISELILPKQFGTVAETVTRDLMSRFMRAFPVLALRVNAAPLNAYKVTTIKVMVNMQAYSLTLGDLAIFVPLFGPVLHNLSYFINFELDSAFEVESATPSWASGAAFSMDYATDSASVTGISFPTGADPRATVNLAVAAFRFRNKALLLLNPPWLDWFEVKHSLQVRNRPPPGNPNDKLSDEVYIIDQLTPPMAADPSEPWIDRDTPLERRVRIAFSDFMSATSGGETRIDVLVNGEAVLTDAVIPYYAQQFWHTFAMKPRLNTVTVRVTRGHEQAGSHGYHAVVRVALTDARNADYIKTLFLNPGQSFELSVYTPPTLSTPP